MKKKIIATVSTVLAFTGIATLFTFMAKKSNNNSEKEATAIETTLETNNTSKFEDLGLVPETSYLEETIANEKIFGEPNGDFKKEELVIVQTPESENIIVKDKEAASKIDEIGKTVIDTKDGELSIDEQGDVVETKEYYEIIDTDSKEVIEAGIGTPEETTDPKLNNLVEADADYWGFDENGEAYIVIPKGFPVEPETLEKAKKYLTTVPPVKETQAPETEPEIQIEEGTINQDGTYTIYGLTFETKADFEQWMLQDGEGYAICPDGIMRSIESIMEGQKSR